METGQRRLGGHDIAGARGGRRAGGVGPAAMISLFARLKGSQPGFDLFAEEIDSEAPGSNIISATLESSVLCSDFNRCSNRPSESCRTSHAYLASY